MIRECIVEHDKATAQTQKELNRCRENANRPGDRRIAVNVANARK
jgi:hypothetical protein